MKKILSLLLCLVMALSVLSVTAFASSLPFADVKTSDWFYADVKTAYEDGLINGKAPDKFDPNANLTYAEAVKLAACMHQRYIYGYTTLTNGSPWYQSYVDYCKANNIITKDYSWSSNATRAGYMEIFANALPDSVLSEINVIPDGSIPDVPMTHPQAASIYKLYRAGILQGSDAKHSCMPFSSIKRSEVAAILTRMMYPGVRISFTIGNSNALAVKTQPTDITAAVGDNVVFSVAAIGGKAPYAYQWQYRFFEAGKYSEWEDLTGTWSYGEKSPELHFKVESYDFEAMCQYRCIITDADGKKVISNTAKVVEDSNALKITDQPRNAEAEIKETVFFSVTVEGGTSPYKYQWQSCMKAAGGSYTAWADADPIWASGATTSSMSFEIGSVEYFDTEKVYRCVITDANGKQVISDAAHVVAKESVLRFTEHPQNITCAIGDKVTLTAAATGGKTPYNYIWQYTCLGMDHWETMTSGANGNMLTFTAYLDDFGYEYQYRCVVTAKDGRQIISNAARLIQK